MDGWMDGWIDVYQARAELYTNLNAGSPFGMAVLLSFIRTILLCFSIDNLSTSMVLRTKTLHFLKLYVGTPSHWSLGEIDVLLVPLGKSSG